MFFRWCDGVAQVSDGVAPGLLKRGPFFLAFGLARMAIFVPTFFDDRPRGSGRRGTALVEPSALRPPWLCAPKGQPEDSPGQSIAAKRRPGYRNPQTFRRPVRASRMAASPGSERCPSPCVRQPVGEPLQGFAMGAVHRSQGDTSLCPGLSSSCPFRTQVNRRNKTRARNPTEDRSPLSTSGGAYRGSQAHQQTPTTDFVPETTDRTIGAVQPGTRRRGARFCARRLLEDRRNVTDYWCTLQRMSTDQHPLAYHCADAWLNR